MSELVHPNRDELLDRYLDGELPEADWDLLREAARQDAELAAELDAMQALRRAMNEMGSERIPAALGRRLHDIAQEAPRSSRLGFARGWWRAVALAIPVLAVAVLWPGQAPEPTRAELDQGRRDLAVALTYLQRANSRAALLASDALRNRVAEPVLSAVGRNVREPLQIELELEKDT